MCKDGSSRAYGVNPVPSPIGSYGARLGGWSRTAPALHAAITSFLCSRPLITVQPCQTYYATRSTRSRFKLGTARPPPQRNGASFIHALTCPLVDPPSRREFLLPAQLRACVLIGHPRPAYNPSNVPSSRAPPLLRVHVHADGLERQHPYVNTQKDELARTHAPCPCFRDYGSTRILPPYHHAMDIRASSKCRSPRVYSSLRA